MSGDALAYRDMLLQLLPSGRAWSRDADGVMSRFFHGLGDGLARADRRQDALLDEADPRTTLELLVDWERVAGLPDACAGAPDTIRERQIVLTNKVAQRGGQSIPFFVELASRLGYFVEIEEATSFDACGACGDALNSDDWRFAWLVDVIIGADGYRSGYSEFTAGSGAGDRLVGFGALDLECLFGRAQPAHTNAIFSYSIEPDPAFWFDFTSET